jgi:hypothetical protein
MHPEYTNKVKRTILAEKRGNLGTREASADQTATNSPHGNLDLNQKNIAYEKLRSPRLK